jgi:hypothetical protein
LDAELKKLAVVSGAGFVQANTTLLFKDHAEG